MPSAPGRKGIATRTSENASSSAISPTPSGSWRKCAARTPEKVRRDRKAGDVAGRNEPADREGEDREAEEEPGGDAVAVAMKDDAQRQRAEGGAEERGRDERDELPRVEAAEHHDGRRGADEPDEQ